MSRCRIDHLLGETRASSQVTASDNPVAVTRVPCGWASDPYLATVTVQSENAGRMRVLVHTAGLTALGALFGLFVNALRPDGIALFRPFVTEAEGAAECVAASMPTRVDVAEARHLLEAREAVFGDVRSAAEYAAGHVSDAVHLPCSADAPRWLASVDKAATVVVYGTRDAEADQVAQSLGANGYQDVRVLTGGFSAWQDGGGSAASGPCEACE